MPPTEATEPYKVVRVFFGTDRNVQAGATSPADRFGSERGHKITYGSCEVSIPRNHVTGELERPFVFKSLLESPEKHIVLLRIDLRSQDEFHAEVASALAVAPERRALIFVHGFNNSFEEAAHRTAQIAHDVKFTGVPLFYSWPSKASALDYSFDVNNADQAVTYLKSFLRDIAQKQSFDSITLIAHSMGNRALTQAFLELKNELGAEKLKVFKELILAAPDIDADFFRNNIAPRLTSISTGITLYASSKDRALLASKKFNGSPRAGDAGNGLVLYSGIETIDATAVSTDLFWGLGHGYVADSRPILDDLNRLVMGNIRARKRGLAETVTGDGIYWKF